MTENMTDLEREIEETADDAGPEDADFIDSENDDSGESDTDSGAESEQEPEQDPETESVSAWDRSEEQAKAAELVAQWKAFYGEKDAALAAARQALIEADDLDKPAAERVAAQEALHRAVLEVEQAKAGAQKALDYQQSVTQPLPPAQQQWLAANPKFKTDPVFAARVRRIAAQIESEGINPGHARMYQELDKRLRAKPAMGKPGARAGGAPVSRQSSKPRGDSERASNFDQKWMRKIGLDPSNKTHLKEWKKNYNDMAMEG